MTIFRRLVVALGAFLALLLPTQQPCWAQSNTTPAKPTNRQTRPAADDASLKFWLQNMSQHHYSDDEMATVLGINADQIQRAKQRLQTLSANQQTRPQDRVLVLPYPGGRHPRIGFLDGAIDPLRDTKVSLFAPWDKHSYVVADVPEAIWSNLGLTYLAHTHIPTIWDKQAINLAATEWQQDPSGNWKMQQHLPNGIRFGTEIMPTEDGARMQFWLLNQSDAALTNMRVQNCVMLKHAAGFNQQTIDNKIFWGPYSVCRHASKDRWIITAWDPLHRCWGNKDCPCLHSDPTIPDCQPNQKQTLHGWVSFYQGNDIFAELMRIEGLAWRDQTGTVTTNGEQQTRFYAGVFDDDTGMPLPARVHLQGPDGDWHLVSSDGGKAVHYDRQPKHLPGSVEVNTTLSPDPFFTHLKPGTYKIRVERGKEYFPLEETLTIGDHPVYRQFKLKRWINMAADGWYSGDTHVHRTLDELPNVMLAEDLNVTFPLTSWVTASGEQPKSGSAPKTWQSSGPASSNLIRVDATHVIYPRNTEYEITRVGDRRQVMGAFFILNHQTELSVGTPPVKPVAKIAREQGALIEFDKHSWPWSLMIAPVMNVDLFELSNNHIWQTKFGFRKWTYETVPPYMKLDQDEEGLTEAGWIDYGFQSYYALINCGLRMRVTAGTASGVHPVQQGFGRVYVHQPDGFSYKTWVTGLNAGHSFVTTGPMMDLRFNGQPAGTTFAGDSGRGIKITGTVASRRPLDRIEIVVNGRVQQTVKPQNQQQANGSFATELASNVTAEGSFWTAVRCYETQREGRVRFAHTNPVYVDVAGKPVRPRKEEVEHIIKRLQDEAEKQRPGLHLQSQQEYQEAIDYFTGQAAKAE